MLVMLLSGIVYCHQVVWRTRLSVSVSWRGQVKQKGRNMFMKIFTCGRLFKRNKHLKLLLLFPFVSFEPLRTSTSYETSQSLGDAG